MHLETAESTFHQTEGISGAQTKYSLSRCFLGTTQTAPFLFAYSVLQPADLLYSTISGEGDTGSKKGKMGKLI